MTSTNFYKLETAISSPFAALAAAGQFLSNLPPSCTIPVKNLCISNRLIMKSTAADKFAVEVPRYSMAHVFLKPHNEH